MIDRPKTADDALQRLIDGNTRFVQGASRFAVFGKEKLADLAGAQHPYATILGCSDSRVAPERVFDADLGDLFVVRVAGNVLSPEVMGSFQYAALHLQTPLFVVLGHERCGAVEAALGALRRGEKHGSRIQTLLEGMMPGLSGLEPGASHEEDLQRGVEANVRWSIRQIMATPEAQARGAQGHMKLIGGIYEISTGLVRFLPEAGS